MNTYQVEVRVEEEAHADIYKTVEVEAEDEDEAERKASRTNGGTVVDHEHNATDIRGPEIHRSVRRRPREI